MRGHRGISSQGGKMPHPHRACCEGTGSCPFTWERQWRWSDLPESTGALKLNRKNGGAKRRSPGLFTLGVTSEKWGEREFNERKRQRDSSTGQLLEGGPHFHRGRAQLVSSSFLLLPPETGPSISGEESSLQTQEKATVESYPCRGDFASAPSVIFQTGTS